MCNAHCAYYLILSPPYMANSPLHSSILAFWQFRMFDLLKIKFFVFLFFIIFWLYVNCVCLYSFLRIFLSNINFSSLVGLTNRYKALFLISPDSSWTKFWPYFIARMLFLKFIFKIFKIIHLFKYEYCPTLRFFIIVIIIVYFILLSSINNHGPFLYEKPNTRFWNSTNTQKRCFKSGRGALESNTYKCKFF